MRPRVLTAVVCVVAIVLSVGITVTRYTLAAEPSATLTPPEITRTVQLINDYYISHEAPQKANVRWQSATYHHGNMMLYSLTQNRKYYDISLEWANLHKFALQPPAGGQPLHSGDLAAALVFLDLYVAERRPERIANISDRFKGIMATGKVDHWTVVDDVDDLVLYAGLGLLSNDPKYYEYMYQLYDFAKRKVGGKGLYSAEKAMWWSAPSFVGKNVYWSRGNGWAMAGLAKALAVLPNTDPHRAEYLKDFQDMAAALKGAQRPDGLWNVNLGNPNDFPGPETSGTGFFAYAIAWGVNSGVLDEKTYRPVAEKAWQGLIQKAVHPDGYVGFVQGVASSPASGQPVGRDSTAPYGVGAVLVAGAEMAKLAARAPVAPAPTAPVVDGPAPPPGAPPAPPPSAAPAPPPGAPPAPPPSAPAQPLPVPAPMPPPGDSLGSDSWITGVEQSFTSFLQLLAGLLGLGVG